MVAVEAFEVQPTTIDGLVAMTMKQVGDERGTVREFYRESAFLDAGLPSLGPWIQLNVTETRCGAVRGLHGEAMHKLVGVASGEAFGVYLDARRGSATFGAVVSLTLVPGRQVLVPPGVCNGFQAISDPVQYLYCFDTEWRPDMEGVAVTPLDPALGIDWPIELDPSDRAMVSAKDRDAPLLAEIASA